MPENFFTDNADLLYQLDRLDLTEPLRNSNIFLDSSARHVDEYRDRHPLQQRDFLLDESFQPDVGQTNGIEHTGRGFIRPLRRITGAFLQRDALGDESP